MGKRKVRELATRLRGRVWGRYTAGAARRIRGYMLMLVSARYRSAQNKWKRELSVYSECQESAGRTWLIIGEHTIPQCYKYRIKQKEEQFDLLGIDYIVESWTDKEACMNSMQLSSCVVFYRVPFVESVCELYAEARRLKVQVIWEVDDLIFDKDVLRESNAIRGLDAITRRGLLRGASLYRKALANSDMGIASTVGLAEEMTKVNNAQNFVVNNALDKETLEIADKIAQRSHVEREFCRIGYGSGTDTHDRDFMECEDALVALMEANRDIVLVIMGKLKLSGGFKRVEERIERHEMMSYGEYMEVLSSCDIALAPLECNTFNNCKSNIKWIEASALGICTVASDCLEFRYAVEQGFNGYICRSKEEWFTVLAGLVGDENLRKRIGQNARTSALKTYGSDNIARRQLSVVVDALQCGNRQRDREVTGKRRLLSVNVYYKPRSFGGSTIVAEEVNRYIQETGEIDVSVVSLIPSSVSKKKTLHRYSVGGVDVYGICESKAAELHGGEPDASAPLVRKWLKRVIENIRPDIIHIHSIQVIGTSVIDLAIEMNIPYIITLHDAWWLCTLQFMIDRRGDYCDQRVIQKEVCIECTGRRSLVEERSVRMERYLRGASRLIVPSNYFKELYADNGYVTKINKNGIREIGECGRYSSDRMAKIGSEVVFGYVGGANKIKGFDNIVKVFKKIESSNIGLCLVDSSTNLGLTGYSGVMRSLKRAKVIEGYTQDNCNRFYGEIDVLLFPTRWKESFGLTVREAQERGIWVICSDAGGVVEDIEEGVNGRIIGFKDDGRELEAAVYEAARIVVERRKERNKRKKLPQIRKFREQADELMEIIREVINES